jgi:hypothetical protein
VWCTLCVVFSSGLLGGAIVLEGFVENILRVEPGSFQEVNERSNQQMVLLSVGTA